MTLPGYSWQTEEKEAALKENILNLDDTIVFYVVYNSISR